MIKLALPAVLALMTAGAAKAEPTAEYPNITKAFLDACVTGELSATAREAAMASNGWTAVSTLDLDVRKFGISPAISKNFDFSKPLSAKEWSREIDGVTARAVVATFPEKRRYPILCAMVVPDVKGAWPYKDAFEAGVEAIGLKGKSTDLPHYFEYSGKVGPTKRPVRAEIFSRTQATPEKKSMHFYVAF